MSDNLPEILAKFSSRGYVIAPAGYGKTHLIALAVNEASHPAIPGSNQLKRLE
jgi:superfamily II DNA or RNA helicase